MIGQQPDSGWLQNAAKKGLISKDPNLNNLFRQTYDKRFAINAQLEAGKVIAAPLADDLSRWQAAEARVCDWDGGWLMVSTGALVIQRLGSTDRVTIEGWSTGAASAAAGISACLALSRISQARSGAAALTNVSRPPMKP